MVEHLKIFLFLIIINIYLSDKKTIEFYENLLKDTTFETLDLVYNEKNIYLRSKDIINTDNFFAYMPKEIIYSSCDFFPFRETIEQFLYDYYSVHKPEVIYENFLNKYLLIYNFMYLKKGDFKKALIYYEDKHKIKEDEYYNFNINHYKKVFTNLIPTSTSANPIYSSIFYSKIDFENADKLGFDVYESKLAINVFEYIYENIDKVDIIIKNIVANTFKDFYYFKNVYNFINKNAFQSVKSNEYKYIYDKTIIQTSFTPYMKKFISKHKVYTCLFVSPILELFRLNNESFDYPLTFFMNAGSGISMKYKNPIKKDEILEYSNMISDDELYINQGIIYNHSPIVHIKYKFKKSNFNHFKKEVCILTRCGGFDIEKFMNSDEESKFHEFRLDINKINYDLLNILKLLELGEAKSDARFIALRMAQTNSKFGNDIENKSLINYKDLILSQLYNLSLEKLYQDYELLKRNIDIIQRKSGSEHLIYNLKNAYNFLKLTINRVKVLNRHLLMVDSMISELLLSDLSIIKKQILI